MIIIIVNKHLIDLSLSEKIFGFFNVFECYCCKSIKLEKKETLFSYAEDIINAKLDIINYLKSILLLDIIKNITMDDKKKC